MSRILQGFSVLFVLVGGVMSLVSNIVTLVPHLGWTDQDRQYWGLFFLVLGIVLFMLGTFVDGLMQDATNPRLLWGFVKTEYKPVHTQYILPNEQRVTEINIHSELEFAYLEIINDPRNPDKGQTAEKAHASLFFKMKGGSEKFIEHGRWCDADMPLLQPSGDVKSWKNVDIHPGSGNPESLVVAFKKKHGNEIYAFNCTDHKRLSTKAQLDEMCKERLLGVPPIEFQVKLTGKFKTKTFDLTLDIDQKENFVIRENK